MYSTPAPEATLGSFKSSDWLKNWTTNKNALNEHSSDCPYDHTNTKTAADYSSILQHLFLVNHVLLHVISFNHQSDLSMR